MQELQLELPALDADDQEPFDSDEELEGTGRDWKGLEELEAESWQR